MSSGVFAHADCPEIRAPGQQRSRTDGRERRSSRVDHRRRTDNASASENNRMGIHVPSPRAT